MGNNRLIDVCINGYIFKGFSDFACINSKTYVVEPERTDDGSMPDINNHVTFFVPRVQIAFKYMKIEDYQRFLIAIEPNEFVVSYFDYTIGEVVYHKMYAEPQELEQIHTYRLDVLGILNKTISLIGTLNSIDTFALTYNANGGIGAEEGRSFVMGEWLQISTGSNLSRDGYTLKEWNTLPNGTGVSILPGTYKIGEENNLTLYAIWQSTSSYTITFDYNGLEKPEDAEDTAWLSSKTVIYGQSIGDLPSPAVDGYIFKGWYVYPEYEPSKYESGQTYSVKGSITLKAKWEEVQDGNN